MCNKIYFSLCSVLLLFLTEAIISAGEVKLQVTGHWLNIPVSHEAEQRSMTIAADGCDTIAFMVRLASRDPLYWVSCDMSGHIGKQISVIYDGDSIGLGSLKFSEGIACDARDIYSEELRPQQHFTFKRGWNNDPNGLIFYDGEYHLFAQHNPYETRWQNMHWGHAVSRDLIHWEELPEAMAPGTDFAGIFSGTTVMDTKNVSGLAPEGKTAMLAFYTLDRKDHEVQHLAYSLDNGRTWIQYKDNPIIDSYEDWHNRDLRDPKVFWHEGSGHWVMVLFEKDGHSFYVSDNLIDWTRKSHICGYYECPDFYELPVDGDPNNTRWVLSSASGAYQTGRFDGETFVPDGPRHNLFWGIHYAGQTFNGFPDGRRVQILWEKVNYGGKMPFCSMFSTPLEMTLRMTGDGIRLFAEPVQEFESLQTLVYQGEKLSAEEAGRMLNQKCNTVDGGAAAGPHVRIKGTLHQDFSTSVGLSFNGHNMIDFNISWAQLCGKPYCRSTDQCSLDFDIIIDSGSYEAFFDHGARVFVEELYRHSDRGFELWGSDLTVEKLEIYSLDSIWE